jgi:hypothetical protein
MYKPKFKVGDIVIYDGTIRPNCPHNNNECGRILKLPNSAQPHYWIGVMAYNGSQLTTSTYGYKHIVTFLTTADNLQTWIPNK